MSQLSEAVDAFRNIDEAEQKLPAWKEQILKHAAAKEAAQKKFSLKSVVVSPFNKGEWVVNVAGFDKGFRPFGSIYQRDDGWHGLPNKHGHPSGGKTFKNRNQAIKFVVMQHKPSIGFSVPAWWTAGT